MLYVLFYRIGIRKHNWFTASFKNLLKNEWLVKFYDVGIDWVFAHKRLTLIGAALSIPLCVLMFQVIGKERMPEIDQNELMVNVEWNENIHIDENHRRVNALLGCTDSLVTEHTAYVGMQDYILGTEKDLSAGEAELYFKTEKPEGIAPLKVLLEKEIRTSYPEASVTFSPPVTIFEKLFVMGEPNVVARLQVADRTSAPQASDLKELENRIAEVTGQAPERTAFRSQLNLVVDRDRLLVGKEKSVNRVLAETLVEAENRQDGSRERTYVPLRELVRVVPDEDLKEITAGRNGEYIPISFYGVEDAPTLIEQVRETVEADKRWDVSFGGSFFSNRKMMGELTVILIISVLLMYFILCAQFESFLQPLIVLAEIPMDIAFGLVVLWALGHTMNLMSAIGIIVSCGIVVNDSILKLDSINELRKEGMPLLEAIHTAGHRRFRTATSALHCHDRHHDGGTVGQSVCHSFDLLVYL